MRRYASIVLLVLVASLNYGCAVYQTTPAYGHEPPPSAAVGNPEFLYVIPSVGVYFVPGISSEVFFVNGRWYYSARGVWYWGTSYSGPWTYIQVRHIPRQLRRLPRDYRSRYRAEYYKVPFGHWKNRRQELPPKPSYGQPSYVRKYKGNVYLHPKDSDVVFHDGYWYRKYKGVWYQGRSSKGPWKYQEYTYLPKAVRKLPPEYRKPRSQKPYKQVPWEKVQKKYRKKMEKRDREWEREDRRR